MVAKFSPSALNETERSCMVLFSESDVADFKSNLPRRVEGTCHWILDHPQYVSWVSKQESTLLWITGNPGCGKTILSAYLMEHLDAVQPAQWNALVCCYFCSDQIDTQKDAKAILRSVIYQMVRRRRKLIRHVKSAFEFQGSQVVNSFEALWNIFVAITSDRISGQLSVIVDAIDECEAKTRARFLDAVTTLVHRANAMDEPSPNRIKFLITSRPSLAIYYDFNGFLKNRLMIEESQNAVVKDVQLVIERRINEIVKRSGCQSRTKEYLEKTLQSKADQTFLWVKFALQCLEESLLAAEKDFRRILSTLPQDLEGLYESFLRSIPLHNQGLAAKMLHILVGSSRHFTLEEFSIILAIDDSHKTVTDVQSDCQPSIRRTLQGILGPLVRISEEKVSLVHQSAKEFLLRLATRSEHPLAKLYGVNEEKAASILASSCISYLLLHEFSENQFSPDFSGSEKSSVNSPLLGRFTVLDEETVFDPLALEQDILLKDEDVLEAEACQSLADRYKFFDYSAIFWARHFALCDKIAPKSLQEDAITLTDKLTCRFFNWLRYFWLKTGMEVPFPKDFDSLTVACFFNHPVLLQCLLHRDENYEQQGKDRALFWAARMGCENAAEILLRSGADPNSMIVGRQTPLCVAAYNGHDGMARLLIGDDRIDVNLRGSQAALLCPWPPGMVTYLSSNFLFNMDIAILKYKMTTNGLLSFGLWVAIILMSFDF